MDLTWRPLTLDDAERMAEVYSAAEEVDKTGEYYSADDFREELEFTNTDLPGGSTGGWDGDRLVAYALVRRRDAANPVHMVRHEFKVRPEYRDDAMGAHLMAWILDTAKKVHAGAFPDAPLELHDGAHHTETWPPAAAFPDGLAPVRYEDRYDELTREARNDTFAGHYGSTVMSPEVWRTSVTGVRAFQPELSFLVLSPSGDEVQAHVLSYFFEADAVATGVRELFVQWVGTRSSLRGKGVATALLGHTLVAAKAAGYERSMLLVDVDNTHRALGVYERCGYQVSGENHIYVLPVG